MEMLTKILTAIAPVIVAMIGIIPTVISNRKKTQESIKQSNESIEKRVEKIQSMLNSHIRENEDEKAQNQRYRILRFYDEICEHKLHSESHFEDILDDIDEYELYCSNHPTFRNGRGQAAMSYIKSTYEKVKTHGGFLTHEDGGLSNEVK